MAILIAVWIVLAALTHTGADPSDACSGSNQLDCITYDGECEWLDTRGGGKCVTVSGNRTMGSGNKTRGNNKRGNHKRGNNTRGQHGGRMRNGTSEEGAKRNGDGMHNRTEENREGKGGGQREGKGKGKVKPNSWHVAGVFDFSIGSSMESAQVLNVVAQQHTLLKNVIAQSHGFTNVAILGVDTARRLRSAIMTRIRVRFQADNFMSPQETVEPTEDELSQALQQSFAKAGLDFDVLSAAVVITSSEWEPSESKPDEEESMIMVGVLLIVGGLIMICTCAAMFCLCRRRRSGANKMAKPEGSLNAIHTAPTIIAKPAKGHDLSEKDLDLASVSTGTPSNSTCDFDCSYNVENIQ